MSVPVVGVLIVLAGMALAAPRMGAATGVLMAILGVVMLLGLILHHRL